MRISITQFLAIVVLMFLFGFFTGLVVAGKTDWECIDQGSICYETPQP